MDLPPRACRPPQSVRSHPVLDKIRQYNALMGNNTKGPNCVDPTQCKAECCCIMIDVPRVLAELYLAQEWLRPQDLRRGGPFAFRLGVSDATAKCIFFDPELNGCRLHFTGYKPPQCWIYPTGFTPGEKTCKKGYVWDIINAERAQEAEQMLECYKSYSLAEVREEISRLKESWPRIKQDLSHLCTGVTPSRFLGLSWGYEDLSVMDAAGFSLQVKSLCVRENPTCAKDFIECKVMCKKVIDAILTRYEAHLDLFFQWAECREYLQIRDLKAE